MKDYDPQILSWLVGSKHSQLDTYDWAILISIGPVNLETIHILRMHIFRLFEPPFPL